MPEGGRFNYSLVEPARVEVRLYGIRGNLVYSRNYPNQGPGDFSLDLNAGSIPKGGYFLVFKAYQFAAAKNPTPIE